ncbi:MAG: hypothetical protein LBG90_09635 [Spirochaetaceae bacterium]|jgi:hypothetical protein|nr:hypothetical protein [Spirochaetaceae bacterium]
MKWFLCPWDDMFLGVPADRIERLFIASPQNEEGLSIPQMFHRPVPAPHAASLKPKGTILLLPRIDIDLDIPDAEIHAMPRAFGEKSLFAGACFRNGDLILLLNIEEIEKKGNSGD